MEGQKYNAWIQLNFGEKDSYDNYKVRQYRPQYGFDLEKTLQKYPIAELKQQDLKTVLIKSLKKGNRHPVTFEKSNKTERMLIEANPQYKTINIFPFLTRSAEAGLAGQAPAAAQGSRVKSGRKQGQEENEDEKENGQEKREEELEGVAAKRQSKKGIGLQ
jgi:ribosomal protein L12E/L44/L45/RPP1/RPP2